MRVNLDLMSKAVELSVAGQRCRVVTSANEAELKILTDMVECKLAGIVKPGRPLTTQAMILAAVALANDVIEHKRRADAVAGAATTALQQLLARVDTALSGEVPTTSVKRARRKRTRGTKPHAAPAPPAAARAQHQQANDASEPS